MTQYKFRGKRKDNGEWVYGDLITKPVHHECVILENGVINHSVDPETVGMCSGIWDKNMNDIYEGDIIKVAGRLLKVVFDAGCFLSPWDTNRYRLNQWGSEGVEIISNIHDHPHLLTPSQKGDVLNTMNNLDPNNAQASEQEAAGQAAQADVANEQGQVNAAESAAQDAAVEATETVTTAESIEETGG